MKSIPLAASLSRITASRIREIADIAFTMKDVLRLQFGESNIPTPRYIKAAACQAMNEGYTFYTENAGLPGLRNAIADTYKKLHGVSLAPKSAVVVTASGVQALNLAIRCIIDPGDEALILTPNWPNATAIVTLYGGFPKEIIMTREASRFGIDFSALESAVTPKTRLLVYTSPSNPLGWVASVEEQKALLAFCRRHDLWLLADEVYERIFFSAPVAPSILRLCSRDDAVTVIQSFSKTFCMTGWRLGWIVSRADFVEKAAQLNEFIVSHAASMIQRAGEIALHHEDTGIHTMVADIKKRVLFCHEALSSMKGVSVPTPEGAFYLFPRIEGVTDSFAFAVALLKAMRVAVAPGSAFGNGGEGSIRICCAAEPSILEPAMERLDRFLEKR